VDEWIDAFDLPLSDHLKKSQPMGLFNGSWSWRDVGERIAYRYFCWRQAHALKALYNCISRAPFPKSCLKHNVAFVLSDVSAHCIRTMSAVPDAALRSDAKYAN
jgi:hypothetical protein